MQIGDLVYVRPAYRQGVLVSPYRGAGYYEADAWTGQTYRVAAIDGNDAGLVDAGTLDVENAIPQVWITLGRLTKQ